MYQVIEELKKQPSSSIIVSDNDDGYWYFYPSSGDTNWMKEKSTTGDCAKLFEEDINNRGYKIKKCYSKIIGYIKWKK